MSADTQTPKACEKMLGIISHQENANTIKTKMMLLYMNVDSCNKKQIITSIGEDVEKMKPSITIGGTTKWYASCGKQSGSFSKLNSELPLEQFYS